MNVRQKGSKVRITFEDTNKPQDINYVTVDPMTCWNSTYNAWGKAADTPLIKIGTRTFKVVLEEVA